MSPAPTAEVPPDPLLWLAEHAIAGIVDTSTTPYPGSMVRREIQSGPCSGEDSLGVNVIKCFSFGADDEA